jgi:iron complex transport system substrate-binding protein
VIPSQKTGRSRGLCEQVGPREGPEVVMGSRSAGLVVALVVACAAPVVAGGSSPKRVVSLAPSLTETVATLDCGAQLVAVSDYAVWPPEALDLPRVGGLYNPNVERILALRPDLVLLPSPLPRLEKVCAAAGISWRRVRIESLGDAAEGFREVAAVLGCPARGEELARGLNRDLEAIGGLANGRPRKKVLMVLDRPPNGRLQALTAVGPGTFLDEMLALVGGDNIFADARQRYFAPSLEAIIERRPEVILELRPGAADPQQAQVEAEGEWRLLFGSEPPEIRVVASDSLLVPGPRMVATASCLAAALCGPADGTP